MDNWFYRWKLEARENPRPPERRRLLRPRFSLSKIFGVNLNVGPLHDILETNRLAFGGGILAYLAGGAIDLNIPGFTYWHQHFFAI